MSNRNELFRNSISKTYDQWQTLKIALQHSTLPQGQFLDWLILETEKYFRENEDLNNDEVSDWLDDIIDTELDVQIRDGSLEQVGIRLCTFFRLITEGNTEEVNKMLEEPLPPPAPVSYNAAGGDSDSYTDSD
jgi:hypothetical protein